MAGKKRGAARSSHRKGPTPRNTTKVLGAVRTDPVTGQSIPVSKRRVSGPPSTVEPSGSSRVTPKLRARGPFRPTWHKVVGALLIIAGLGLFVINDLAWFDIELLPGGHNELWALLGIMTAASSTWWFGWFDRTPRPGRG